MHARSFDSNVDAGDTTVGRSEPGPRSCPGWFGWTFGEETDTYYGAKFGVGLSNNLQIVGGFETMNDVLTGRYALLLFGDNFMAEATFDFLDVLAEREDFSTVSALRPAFASSQSSF